MSEDAHLLPEPDTIMKIGWRLRFAEIPDTEFLWGIIREDSKARFRPGDYCFTSAIQEELAAGCFRTRNTLYKVEHIRSIVLPMEAFKWLSAGISPEEIETFLVIRKAQPDAQLHIEPSTDEDQTTH